MSKNKTQKQKMTKDVVPEGFTLSLALTDAIPVLFFGASMVAVSFLFSSRLFLFGALLCLIAGAAKVLWKIIVVLKKKNIWALFIQMRILMPIGLLIMIIAVILKKSAVDFSGILSAALSFPPVIFFGSGILGMVLKTVFAFSLDSSSAKANFTEQLTNGIAQACFFTGLVLVLLNMR